MIVHFVRDEKIIDQVIENFERVNSGRNVFLLFREEKDQGNFVYVKQKDKVREFFFCKEDIKELMEGLGDVKGVILHSLDNEFAKVALQIEKETKIYWFMWGYDIYSLPKIKPTLFGKKTLAFLKERKKGLKFLWGIKNIDLLRALYYKAIGNKDPYSIVFKMHKRIDYCVSYMLEDFEVLNRHYPNRYKFMYATFLSLEQYIGRDFMQQEINGENVMIGNSTSPECNHLDVFEHLSGQLEGKKKVYVPLSYGIDTGYKEKVLRDGKRLLGERFSPMTNFMGKDEYIKVLLSCNVGIFYHYRQQAMGNIIAMLWLGARIYLAKKNPVYGYLKRLGIHVYILEEEFGTIGFKSLGKNLVVENRAILSREFNEEKVYNDTKKLVESFNR